MMRVVRSAKRARRSLVAFNDVTCFTGKWAPQASGHLMPRPTQSILLMYELYNIIYKLHIKHSLAGFGTFEPCAQMNNKRYNEAVLAFVAPEVVAR